MGKTKKKPYGYWNVKERCLEDAKKYKTQSEWRVNSLVAYNNASKNGWLRICFPPKKAWYL